MLWQSLTRIKTFSGLETYLIELSLITSKLETSSSTSDLNNMSLVLQHGPKPQLKIYPQPFIGGRSDATRLQEARRRSGGKTLAQLLQTFLSMDAHAPKTL